MDYWWPSSMADLDTTPGGLLYAEERTILGSFDPYDLGFSVRTRLDDPMMFVPRLPLEIVDAIANELRGDPHPDTQPLNAMSTVCRAWVGLARKDSGGALGPLVKTARVCLADNDHKMAEVRIPITTYMTLFNLLPNLQDLSLSTLPSGLDEYSLQDHCAGRGISLKRLEIVDYEFIPGERIAHFVTFLNYFSEIQELKVSGGEYDEEDWIDWERSRRMVQKDLNALGEAGMIQTRIRSVDVSTSTMEEVLMIMTHVVHVQYLQKLHVFCGKLKEFSALCDLIHVVEDHLLDLTFTIMADPEDDTTFLQDWQENESKISYDGLRAMQQLQILDLFKTTVFREIAERGMLVSGDLTTG
ncbi:hypothetical protein EUX98_g7969 [Antrodiella citrinella]|uniref:F-box domain-containing protein n=1 Tax=Antrodiella citrinella TaxID=2447956 RepID=A0A4S4MCQ5_9APHY|nr:hypothetical protein EUX98_g7969 [Antrodiella citrinella]